MYCDLRLFQLYIQYLIQCAVHCRNWEIFVEFNRQNIWRIKLIKLPFSQYMQDLVYLTIKTEGIFLTKY